MSNKLVKIWLLFVIIFSVFFVVDVNASGNLLTGEGMWKGYFSGDNQDDSWTQASGKLTSNSVDSFVIDMSSVGHWVEGDHWWHFGAQAQLINQKISLKMNNYYTYKATLTSDKDRVIFVKIVESELNPDKGVYEDIDNVLLEKWVTLQKNVPCEVEESFLATSNVSDISIYYAVGWSDNYDIASNASNVIEAKSNAIFRKKQDVKTFNYEVLKRNGVDTKYSYNNVMGVIGTDIYDKDNIRIRLKRTAKIVSRVRVNGKRIRIKSSNNSIYIPLNKMRNEYNDITIYSETSQQHKTMILSKVIVRNDKISTYKKKKLDELSKYENDKNSEVINNIIARSKRELEDTMTEIDAKRVVDEFKIDYEIQKITETGKKVVNKKNANSLVGIVLNKKIIIIISVSIIVLVLIFILLSKKKKVKNNISAEKSKRNK